MIPHERSLVKKLEGKPFALLGINSDSDRDDLKKTITRDQITWRSWWDGGDTNGPIASKWNIRAWPTTYVLDAKGVIRFKDVRDEKMERAIEQLLAEIKLR